MSEIEFYLKDSGVKSVKFKETAGKKLMLVQFGYAENFWKGLNWAPTHQEVLFILHHLDLTEKFNYGDEAELQETTKEIDLKELDRILWNEKVQQPRQLSSLPNHFYFLTKRCLSKLLLRSMKSSNAMKEYAKASNIYSDIVKTRVNKIFYNIVRETDFHLSENLTPEEKELCNRLKMLYDGFLANTIQVK